LTVTMGSLAYRAVIFRRRSRVRKKNVVFIVVIVLVLVIRRCERINVTSICFTGDQCKYLKIIRIDIKTRVFPIVGTREIIG
jgi:hypothetical protein